MVMYLNYARRLVHGKERYVEVEHGLFDLIAHSVYLRQFFYRKEFFEKYGDFDDGFKIFCGILKGIKT